MKTGQTIDEGITDNTGQALFNLERGEYGAEITLPEGFELFPGQDNPVDSLWIDNGLSTHVTFEIWDSSVPLPDGQLTICAYADSSSSGQPDDFDVDLTVRDAAMNIRATRTVQSDDCVTFDLEPGIYSVEFDVPSGYELVYGQNPIEGVEVDPYLTSRIALVFRKLE